MAIFFRSFSVAGLAQASGLMATVRARGRVRAAGAGRRQPASADRPARLPAPGVYIVDLRLPEHAAISLIRRGEQIFVPDRHSSLEAGDHVLLVVSEAAREATERRLRSIGRDGRLAAWYENT